MRAASTSMLPVLLVGAGLTLLAASGPTQQAEPAVRVATLALERTVFASVPPHRHQPRPAIQHLVADGDHLVASTSAGAFWFDAAGRLVRRLEFPRKLGHTSVATLKPGGRPVFVGATDAYGRRLLLIPADGTRPTPLRLDGVRAKFADVLGDAGHEVVASEGDTLLVYALDGRLLRRVRASDYVWDFQVLNTNASPAAEIVAYLYQSRKDGGYIEVLDAEGERIRSWHEPEPFRYAISHWSAPDPALVHVRDGVITERSPKGTLLRQITVPGLGSHRHPATGRLPDGTRVLLVHDGCPAGRLIAFDETGAVVYDASSETFRALHVPVAAAGEFFVGGEATIWRFRVPAAGAASPR